MLELENQRYNDAIRALAGLGDLPEEEADITRQILLEEHFATQRALDRLHFGPGTELKDIPGINQVYFRSKDTKYTSPHFDVIEVGGMPRAGKTSSIGKISQDERFTILDESWREILAMLDDDKTEDYQDIEGWKIARQGAKIYKLVEQIEREQKPRKPILSDRDWIDSRAFLRANFISDRIREEVFVPTLNFIRSTFEDTGSPRRIRYNFILCLIPPKLALDRKLLSEEPGRFSNLRFLNTLYKQYLRLHYELSSNPGVLNYACLDFTSGTIAQNAERMREVIDKMLL